MVTITLVARHVVVARPRDGLLTRSVRAPDTESQFAARSQRPGFQHQFGPAPLQSPQQGLENVGRPVADRKDLARFFHLGGDAFVFDQFDQVGGSERRQRRVQEVPLLADRPG